MRKKNDRDNQEFTIEETILIERLRSFRVPAMVEEYKQQLWTFCLSRNALHES